MVDYDYNLNFIGNNFTNDSVVKVTLSLTDNNSNNISNTKVDLTSENGEVLTSYTDDNGLAEFNVTRTGKWTASTDLTGCNTTYRTITVNHTVNSLYNAFMSLINQRYYNKNEIQDLIPSVKDSGVYDGVLYISYDNQEDLSLTIDDVYEETFSVLQTNYIFHLIDTKNINTSTILKDEEENGIEGVVISIKDENDNVIGKNVTDNNGESSVSFDMGDDDTKSIKAVTKNLETDIETFYYTYKDTNTFKIMLVWNDNNNSSNRRPSSVTVYMKRDGVSMGDISLNEANGWQVTREYPLEDEYGNTYTYEWDISGVSNYPKRRIETYNNLTIGILSLIDGSAPPTPTGDDEVPDVPTPPGDIPERPRS